MVDRDPLFSRETLPQREATSLGDMQPSVLKSASFSPLLDSPLDRASSRVEQVIETMASYRGAKTPQLDQVPKRSPQGALKDIIREKEIELATIAAQRNRALTEQLERVQDQERKGKEEITKLRSQLKQLTKDFQFNLELLKDRDTELDLLENQIKAHKETSETRSQELSNAIRRIDEAKALAASNECRAEQAVAEKAVVEERCANKIAVLQREHEAAMADYAIQLESVKAQLGQERQGISASHGQRIQKLEGELARVQAQLHSANATIEQSTIQQQATSSRCYQAEHDLKVAADALSSLEGEHRKFVEQATALCNQKDAVIVELKDQLNIDKQLSCSQAMIDSEKHSARVKDLEAAVRSEKEITAATAKQLSAAQAELLSCKAEHQKQAAESQQQLSFCRGELDACRRELTLVHTSFAAKENENTDNMGRSGKLLAQSHFELQHKDAELQQLHQEVTMLREDIRCTENARNAACQQIQELTSEMDKMALVHTSRIGAAEARADSAEQRLKVSTKEKRTVTSAIEKQVSIWGKKFESQAKAHRQQMAQLEQQCHDRLAQARHEHAGQFARQSAEAAGVREECQIAISRIRDAQEYVQMLEEQLHERSDQVATLAWQNRSPKHHGPQATCSAPASPMQGTVVCSTTLNVPSTSGKGMKACQCCHGIPGSSGTFHVTVPPAEHPACHGPELPHHASVAQPGVTHTTCAHAHSQCVQGHASRMPLADAGNMPAAQHHAQRLPLHVPGQGCCHGQMMASHSHRRGHASQDPASRSRDVLSGRYRCTSLMRTQRLQDRLKASERDLTYRLGRLLGREDVCEP